jgi:hypothetical protein
MSDDFDFSEFFNRAGAKLKHVQDACLHAVDEYGDQKLGDAQQICPIGGEPYSPRDPAPGTLKDSATSEPAKLVSDGIEKIIGFNTEYAAVQHENLEFRHSHGQAKYLAIPLADTSKFAPYVASKAKAAMES